MSNANLISELDNAYFNAPFINLLRIKLKAVKYCSLSTADTYIFFIAFVLSSASLRQLRFLFILFVERSRYQLDSTDSCLTQTTGFHLGFFYRRLSGAETGVKILAMTFVHTFG